MERGLFGFGEVEGMMRWIALLGFCFSATAPLLAADRSSDEIKSAAYQLYSAKQIEKALAEFRAYLERRPDDLQAKLDFAGVLSEAKQHEEAARVLEQIRSQRPAHESARFKLAVEYVYLGRSADAEKLLAELEKSPNSDLAEAATDARRKLQTNIAREARLKAEQDVFALADKFEQEKIISAVDELEKTGPLTFALAMQRLYAMHSLRQYAPALERADRLAKVYPAATDLALLRADLLAQLGRQPEAAALWRRIEREHPGTPAADQASRRRGDIETWLATDRVYELARQGKHREVLVTIDEMEHRGPLPFPMEMQRLHALVALGQRKRAAQKADELSRLEPNRPELATFQAALTAMDAKPAPTLPPPPLPEANIYALANAQRYRETVAAIDELERTNRLSFAMQMQRLYALQAVRDSRRAQVEAGELQLAFPDAPEVALIRADLLIQDKKWEDASLVLKHIRHEHGDSSAGTEASRRLDALPPMANLDKWYWGEAYNSGDYLERFHTLVGSGFLRHGYFVPFARWLQPYAEFRYTVDTRSSVAQRSIISDNFVGAYLGARAQPFVSHYLFAYVQAGFNKDFLDRREEGDWAYDSQAGVYGFKSWGRGTVLLTFAPGEAIRTSGNVSNPAQETSVTTANGAEQSAPIFWRGDWFTDAGADFSYYHRHSSWIGYGQAHEGFRLFQIGPHAAVDGYLVENLSWDIRGDYFDNLIELGPGFRLLWVPRRRWEVILRTEWLNGFYFGRNDLNNRGDTDSHYDDLRVGLSVGTRW